MSYLGAVGFIMGGSGLETLWETVYASGSVIHMMTGHEYSRAVRAHLLTSISLLAMLLSNHEHLNREDQRQKLCSLQALLMNTDCSNVDVFEDTAIRDLHKTISNAMNEERRKSRTGDLWINYMDKVSLLKMFLYAERTGFWRLHLYCSTKM